MSYPKSITITFIKSDFDGNDYMDTHDCPLARAVKRELEKHGETPQDVSVGWIDCTVWQSRFDRLAVADYKGESSDKVWGPAKFLALQHDFAIGKEVNHSITMELIS